MRYLIGAAIAATVFAVTVTAIALWEASPVDCGAPCNDETSDGCTELELAGKLPAWSTDGLEVCDCATRRTVCP